MYKECKFNLDINNGTANNIRAVQKDDIKLKVKLTNKGKSIDLSRQVITLGVTRHDQQTINQIDGFVGDENGNIEGLLKDGITSVAGISKLQFTFDGSQGQSSTPEFNLILQPKIILNQDGSESGTEGLDEDKIQMYKLTTDSGYAKNKIKDCNECLHNGDYYLASPVKNGFDGKNSLFLSVNAMSNAIKVQTGVSVTGKVAYRLMIAGDWKSWTTTEFGKVIEINDVNGLQTALDNKADDLELETLGKLLGTEIDLKADKAVAQLYKLTADDGDLIILKDGDVNEIDEPRKYYCRNIKNTPKPYGAMIVMRATYKGKPDIYQFFITANDRTKEVILYWRWRNANLTWDEVAWERLPKMEDLNLKADKSYVDMADNTLKSKIDTVESSMNAKWNGKADLNYTQSELSKKADKSVAQMFKLTRDSGDLIPIDNKVGKIDDLTTPGFYRLSKVDGAPFGYCTLLVFKIWGEIQQIAFEPRPKNVMMRGKTQSGWSDWVTLTNLDDLSTKADIDKAQMVKLTQDDGDILKTTVSHINELVSQGFYRIDKNAISGAPFDYGTVLVFKWGMVVQQIAFPIDAKAIFLRGKINASWSDWIQLATTSDLATVKTDLTKAIDLKADKTYVDSADNAIKADVKKIGTDLTKATTVQPASGNNLNDYFDHNGKITGINLVGAPLEMNGHNVIVECSSYTNTGSTQEITDLVTGVKMLRTYTSGKWTRWQKLGGVDAKIKTQENTRIIELEKRIAQLESK